MGGDWFLAFDILLLTKALGKKNIWVIGFSIGNTLFSICVGCVWIKKLFLILKTGPKWTSKDYWRTKYLST